MRIKVIYRKNLKMSEGKLAAQVAHAVKKLIMGRYNRAEVLDCDIVVLGVSDKKFEERHCLLILSDESFEIQTDKGLTEIEEGTDTAMAWVETE